MANKKIVISIEVKNKDAKKHVDDVSKSTEVLASKVTLLTKAEQEQIIAEEKSRIQKKKLIADLKAQAAAEMSVANAANASKTQNGLNNAILLETSRLASDASYGFTAMANNLGQIVSLFFSFSKTAGGALASLKQLAGSLLGTGGLLIAVQLLIAFGDDIYNFFTGASEAANKFSRSLEKLKADIQGQRRELLGYIEVLKDANISDKVRLNALKELEVASPNLVEAYNNQKISLDELTDQVEEYIRQQRLRAELDAVIDANSELFAERERIRTVQEKLDNAETQEQRKQIFEENSSLLEKIFFESEEAYQAAGGKGWIARFFGLDSDVDYSSLFKAQTQDTVDEYDAAVKRIIDIESQITARPDEKKGGRSRRARVFKEGDLDFQKEIQRSAERELKTSIEKEQSLAVIQFQGIRDRARLKVQEFEEDQTRRLEDFKKKGATDKELLDAQKKFDESIRKSKEELSQYIEQLDEEEKAVLLKIQKEHDQKILQLAYQKQVKEAEIRDIEGSFPKLFAEEATKIKQKQYEFEIGLQRGIVESHKEGTIERAEAERRLVDLQKQYAQEKVAYDQQRFDQIKHMYGEFEGAVGFISEAIKNKELKDAGDSEEAREKALKKAFKIQKAMKISSVIMDTYEAGIKAYGSQLIIGDPTSPIRAQIAQALTLAKGIAQVAAIASTQFGSKSLSGGGAKGKATVEAPDFNVVGASQESQLAQTVAGQQAKPLKAFVVGKEITSQQELDRNIETTASVGG